MGDLRSIRQSYPHHRERLFDFSLRIVSVCALDQDNHYRHRRLDDRIGRTAPPFLAHAATWHRREVGSSKTGGAHADDAPGYAHDPRVWPGGDAPETLRASVGGGATGCAGTCAFVRPGLTSYGGGLSSRAVPRYRVRRYVGNRICDEPDRGGAALSIAAAFARPGSELAVHGADRASASLNPSHAVDE